MQSLGSLDPQTRKKKFITYATIGLLGLITVAGVVVFLAQSSKPGDALYGVKTGLVERAPLLLQSSDQAQVTHLEGLLANRHREIQELIVRQQLTNETAAAIQVEMENILASYEAALTNGEMSPSETLASTQTVMAYAEAVDTLTFKEVDDEVQKEFSAIKENASDIAFTERNRFLENVATSTVETYVSEQIASLGTKLDNENITQTDLADIGTFITRANDALVAGKFERSVAFMTRAQLIADLARFQTLPYDLTEPPSEAELEGEG